MTIRKLVKDTDLGLYMDYGGIESGKLNPLLPAVNPAPLTFVPTLTGNATNLNELVTDVNGDKWFIDYGGDAVLIERAVQTFQALKTTNQTSNTVWSDLAGWQAPIIVGNAMSFNASTGELTLSLAGTYELSAWAMWHASGNNRIETALKFQVNGVDAPNAFDRQYAIRNTAQDMGTSQVSGYLYVATAGDVIKVQEQRVGTTANIENARFAAKKIN